MKSCCVFPGHLSVATWHQLLPSSTANLGEFQIQAIPANRWRVHMDKLS